MPRYLLSIAMMAVVGACASGPNGGSAQQQGCALAPGDSVYLKGRPVYRECAVEQRATAIDRTAHPELHLSSPPPGGHACYSAEIEFVVDEQGIPEIETATVLHTNNEEFARATMTAISRWHYKPALLRGSPVRQIVREQQKVSVELVAVPAGQMPRPPARAPVC